MHTRVTCATRGRGCMGCPDRASSVWRDLPPEQVAALDRAKVASVYRPGEVIHHQGTACFGLHCVQRGTVALRRVDRRGDGAIDRLVHGGQVLGLATLFGGETYSQSAVALTPTEVCFVERSCVLRVLDESPAAGRRLLRRLGEDLRAADEERLRAATRTVRERVARLVLDFADRYGVEAPDGALRFELPLARQDMAALLCVRAESVARAVRALSDEGVARFDGRDVTVPALDQLLAVLPEGD